MPSSIIVDDSNPAVQYAPGWIWDQLVSELDNTRHGAAISGLKAWLSFSGTGIEVVGTLGPTDQDGQPTTTYAIDGTVVATYNAPVTSSGNWQYNVTFFSKLDLLQGDHEVLITYVSDAPSTVYWLDYFVVHPSPDSPLVPTQAPTTSSSRPSASESAGVSTSTSLGNTTDTGTGTSSSSGPARHSTRIASIVGGVVGGVVLFILLLIILLQWRKRRGQRPRDSPGKAASIEETGDWRTSLTRSSPPGHTPTLPVLAADNHHPPPPDSSLHETCSPNEESVSERSYTRTNTTVHRAVIQEATHAPWYAPRGAEASAKTLLQALTARSLRRPNGDRGGAAARDLDSGLRAYNDPALPPAYTPG